MKARYRVTEGPFGPRGGRRFTLDGYDGPRAGMIYRLKCQRACAMTHRLLDCDCFERLSDQQLKLVTILRRKINGGSGLVYGSDVVARLIRRYDETTLRTAIDLYVRADRTAQGGPPVEEYLALMGRHSLDTMRAAVELFAGSCGTPTGGPPLQALVLAVETANSCTPG